MSRRRPQRRFGSISYSQHTSYEPRCQKFRSKSQLDYSAGYRKHTINPGVNWLTWLGMSLFGLIAGLPVVLTLIFWTLDVLGFAA